MFFLLSKILDIAFSPLCWGILLIALSLLAPFVHRPKIATWLRRAAPMGLLIQYLFSTELVANAIWRAVEAPPLTTIQEDVRYDAVILLGGMLDDRAMATYGKPYYNDNVDRLLATWELLSSQKAQRALLSGGDGNPGYTGMEEAEILKKQLVRWGVAPERLFVENKSRNTHENAVESATIVRKEGWSKLLLVTSAFHMPRALGCFRAVGLEPDTLAVDLRSDRTSKGLTDLLPRTRSLNFSATAIRELSGRMIYRIRGFSR